MRPCCSLTPKHPGKGEFVVNFIDVLQVYRLVCSRLYTIFCPKCLLVALYCVSIVTNFPSLPTWVPQIAQMMVENWGLDNPYTNVRCQQILPIQVSTVLRYRVRLSGKVCVFVVLFLSSFFNAAESWILCSHCVPLPSTEISWAYFKYFEVHVHAWNSLRITGAVYCISFDGLVHLSLSVLWSSCGQLHAQAFLGLAGPTAVQYHASRAYFIVPRAVLCIAILCASWNHENFLQTLRNWKQGNSETQVPWWDFAHQSEIQFVGMILR